MAASKLYSAKEAKDVLEVAQEMFQATEADDEPSDEEIDRMMRFSDESRMLRKKASKRAKEGGA